MNPLQDRLQRALGASYRVDRELGGGGMSHVFVAEEVALGRRVVVKVLPPELAAGVSAERFRREIQLAAQLQHPGIVPLLTAGADGDLLWYVMPFVEGESLRTRLARGPLPVDEAVRLWRDLLEALEYAHGRGIVHRDIKPENIMLTGRRAVTLDFGVAKAVSASTSGSGASATGVGFVVGTPAYMAPEQAAADTNVDARADLYAAGLVMYEMLAGRGPFEARTPAEWMAAHIATTPVAIRTQRAEVGEGLSALLMQCLAKSPADRPAHASAVLSQVDRNSFGAPAAAKVRTASPRLALLAVVILVAVIGGAMWFRTRTADGSATVGASGALADSSRLQVAILPVVADSRDSILAQSVVQAQIASLQSEPVLLAQTPKRVRDLANDIGLQVTTPDSLRQLYRDLGIHAYLQHTLVRSGDGLLLIAEGFGARTDSALFRIEAPMNSAAELSSTTATVVRDATTALRTAAGKLPPPPVSGRLLGTTPEAAALYLQSRIAFDNTEYAQSAKLLREVLKADPEFAMAWSALSSSTRNGNLSLHESAVASANAYRLRNRIPSRVRRVFEEINYLRNIGYLDSALVIATRASSEFPSDMLVKAELGLAHASLRNAALSAEAYRPVFEMAVKSRMANVGVPNYVAALLRDNRMEEARVATSRAVAALGESDGIVIGTREQMAMAQLQADSLVKIGHERLRRSTRGRDRLPAYSTLSAGMLLAGRLDSAVVVESARRGVASAEGAQVQVVTSIANAAYWRATLLGADRGASAAFAASLRAVRWDTLPALDRAYGAVIQAQLASGDLTAARLSFAEWNRTVPKDQLVAQRPFLDAAAGAIALMAGEGDAALRAFRSADVGRCVACGAARIAHAFDLLKQPDSVIVWYERVVANADPRLRDVDILDYARAYRRLGELYEAKGDTKRAIQRYSDFVELWKNADPALQPLVKDVRERIARLQKKSG